MDRARRARLGEDLAAFAATLRSGLAHLDFAGRQRLVRLLLERVVITGDHVAIEHVIPLSGRFAGLRLRDRRVGVCPLWWPDARRRHHRGPRRDPPVSHPPRAPDRSISAPTAAVRPLRLELKSARRCRPSQADAPGVSARRYLAPAAAPSGARPRPRSLGRPP